MVFPPKNWILNTLLVRGLVWRRGGCESPPLHTVLKHYQAPCTAFPVEIIAEKPSSLSYEVVRIYGGNVFVSLHHRFNQMWKNPNSLYVACLRVKHIHRQANKQASKHTLSPVRITVVCAIAKNHCFSMITDTLESSHSRQTSTSKHTLSPVKNHCFCVISENHCFCAISDTLECSHSKQTSKQTSTQTLSPVRITVFVCTGVKSQQANKQTSKHTQQS